MIVSKQIQLSESEIYYLLSTLDVDFAENLRKYLDLSEYSNKLQKFAKFVVAFLGGSKVGVVAYYVNDTNKEIFVPYVCVSSDHRRMGIAESMFTEICSYADSVCYSISLEVRKDNLSAIHLYRKYGFCVLDYENEMKLKMKRS